MGGAGKEARSMKEIVTQCCSFCLDVLQSLIQIFLFVTRIELQVLHLLGRHSAIELCHKFPHAPLGWAFQSWLD